MFFLSRVPVFTGCTEDASLLEKGFLKGPAPENILRELHCFSIKEPSQGLTRPLRFRICKVKENTRSGTPRATGLLHRSLHSDPTGETKLVPSCLCHPSSGEAGVLGGTLA